MVPSLEYMRGYIKAWNISYPIDYWWRKKHKVPFGSEKHRQHNFVDMKLEYLEDLMYRDLRKKDELSDSYKPGTGSWLKKRKVKKLSQAEIDAAFEDLDLRQIQKTEDGRIML